MYQHPECELLRVYGLISVQRLYIEKYTKTIKKLPYRSKHQEFLERIFRGCLPDTIASLRKQVNQSPEDINPSKHDVLCKQ